MAVSAEYVQKLLSYDPATGGMRWLVKRTKNSKANIGDIAGSLDEGGYWRVMIDGRKYRVHRLAFLFMGQLMPKCVDHINGDRTDNRWANLRPATELLNAKNASRRRDNVSGVTGVGFMPQRGKWRVRLNHEGRSVYLGLFDTKEEAVAARIAANPDFGFSSTHGRQNWPSPM